VTNQVGRRVVERTVFPWSDTANHRTTRRNLPANHLKDTQISSPEPEDPPIQKETR